MQWGIMLVVDSSEAVRWKISCHISGMDLAAGRRDAEETRRARLEQYVQCIQGACQGYYARDGMGWLDRGLQYIQKACQG
jgi:hypothetical protein